MLTVETLKAAYGAAQVLFDVSFTVGEGEMVTLLGRNGMGKTTTISTIMGLMPAAGGQHQLQRRAARRAAAISRRPSGARPGARRPSDFSDAQRRGEPDRDRGRALRPAALALKDVYEMFPSLAERRRNMGNQLSGGEQQMLAIGRSLMTNPKLLILDEATEGLAPLIRNEIWASLKRLKAEGQAILLVDKHIDALLKLADRHVVIEKGYVVWSGSSAALLQRSDRAAALFAGVRHSLIRHHRGGLDLEPRFRLDQAGDGDQRHRRIMVAHHLPIDFAERRPRLQIFVHVADVPGHAHDVAGGGRRLRPVTATMLARSCRVWPTKSGGNRPCSSQPTMPPMNNMSPRALMPLA